MDPVSRLSNATLQSHKAFNQRPFSMQRAIFILSAANMQLLMKLVIFKELIGSRILLLQPFASGISFLWSFGSGISFHQFLSVGRFYCRVSFRQSLESKVSFFRFLWSCSIGRFGPSSSFFGCSVQSLLVACSRRLVLLVVLFQDLLVIWNPTFHTEVLLCSHFNNSMNGQAKITKIKKLRIKTCSLNITCRNPLHQIQ